MEELQTDGSSRRIGASPILAATTMAGEPRLFGTVPASQFLQHAIGMTGGQRCAVRSF
jgi:hypothetical protein